MCIRDSDWAAEAWTAARIAAGALCCVVAVVAFTPSRAWLRRGLLTSFAVVSLFYSWPATLELWAGQPNLFAMLPLAAAALAHRRGSNGLTGLLLGLPAAIKTWPALFLVWLFRRGSGAGVRSWLGVAIAASTAVIPAIALGGWQGLLDMVAVPLRGADQPDLAANSVWGIARLLFQASSVGEPLLVSPLLQSVTSAALALLVLGLGALILTRPGNASIALYNLAFVIILLLPLSHYFYLLYPLPALWWWVAQIVLHPRWRTGWYVATVLLLWWVVVFRIAPAGDGFATTTWQSLTRIFVATLVAAIVSAVGATLPGPERSSAAEPV